MNDFYQDAPVLGNQFLEDQLLQRVLSWRLPAEVNADVRPGLQQLGERVIDDILAMAADAEANPPRLVNFDPWGRRIDEVQVAPGWRCLHRAAAEEGMVAVAYERAHGQWSRPHQLARLYLFHPSSALYSCPVAMTDGAARVLELYGDGAIYEAALKHLTTRDPALFWTAGQWMTERTGGSDVSGTSTRASLVDGAYRLYGDKWFTSATTADMALALAKLDGAESLSLFYLETRDAQGRLNHIHIHRLKDKLGTRAMPTAELTLHGTPARLIGEPGKGVRNIATMLNITRFHNAIAAVSTMRRGLALARDYAARRIAFGKPLIDHPLHRETLADLELEFQASLHLVFHVGDLLGKVETGPATDADQTLLRLLTPIAKLFTGKRSVVALSEIIECFGGAGYIEDTGLPRLLRDAQVLPIWEGTTNVLSLDVLRVMDNADTFACFEDDVRRRLAGIRTDSLRSSCTRTLGAMERVRDHPHSESATDPEAAEAGARMLAFSLARIFAASLMLAFADWCSKSDSGANSVIAAIRWCERDLAPLRRCDKNHREATRALALG